MAATVSQLSCFSAINRTLQLQRRSIQCPSLRCKFSVVMSLEGHGADTTSSDIKSTLSYTDDVSKLHVEETEKSYPSIKDHDAGKVDIDEPVQEGVSQQQRAAKIHDFCLGIPFGGLVLSGGIIGFTFSRNPATLSSGVLFGGALLFLSTFSLKIWRQGKSSLPFILGQAALSGALLLKNFQTYSLTKRVFPAGFSAIISAAMLSFYLYVLISGGNPPPKKLKSSASLAPQ
ncbi:protein FATTY ACID EXPORT 1, chloroplastic [Quillaja saponaria]|uniref:Protein FATTY ACID EXPORT 1, chloroplastic n=1 Tax=Quillaja saponaria TaxID=32244 RepID=A0AAD7Q8G8_QUISA|nr:protein FATTY ACID EXPORT 1, chloroplastic [Quillaja saponaria]